MFKTLKGFIIGVLAVVFGSILYVFAKADDKKVNSVINSAFKNS